MNERKPLSGSEYYALRELFGIVSTFMVASKDIEKRIRAIPNGWRDYRLIQATSERLLNNVLETVPLEKLAQIKKEIHHTTVEIKVTKDYTGKAHECFTYVPQSALEWLEMQVLDNACCFCDKTQKESKKCPIRKNIESLYMYDFPEPVSGCPLASYHLEELKK